ncbi:hypothetical protein [Jiangella rhizosphaerae]|uniref:hypothetical protein n=1 Tax=Jiangella rhizosphaerae TaxID=2293569 RepID=UPI0011C36894|nr:hypothetical protein [Jiangella rhizosphaerae]
MAQPFNEYREVTTAEPLRQCDVLEAVDATASMWQRLLFVITADCDLANKKHQGRVTCVPILSAHEYLLQLRIPRIRELLIRSPLIELKELLERSGFRNATEARLREWILEESNEAVATSLKIDQADRARANNIIQRIRLIDTPVPTLDQAASSLIESEMLHVKPPKREAAVKKVLGLLRDSYKKPPGDALFLSSPAPEYTDGYFVYMRHLEQVWEPEIATLPGVRNVRYRRISRLRDKFTHALAQRFALVFMSIGLPADYEYSRDLHSELLGELVK